MKEQEKPYNAWDNLLNTELSEAIDELGIVVTLEFYRNKASRKIYSFAYETRLSAEVQPHKPKKDPNRSPTTGNYFNVTDLESFVKEFTDRLEYEGYKPESPQEIEIRDGNNIGLLIIHQHDMRSDIKKRRNLGLGDVLFGVMEYLQRLHPYT